MSFSPIHAETAADVCTRVLRDHILTGAFPVGSRLPAERDLAQQFEVTRVTVRSALARLTAEGLVLPQTGRGTTVLDFRKAAGPGLLSDVVQRAADTAVLRDLLAVRRALAHVVLTRIIERAADPAPLREPFHAFARCVRDAPSHIEAIAEADAKLVEALVHMADSDVLTLCAQPVLRAVSESAPLRAVLYRSPHENVVAWDLLLHWLETPQASALPSMMQLLEARDAETLASLESKCR